MLHKSVTAKATTDSAKKGYVGIHSSGFRDFLLKPELLRAIIDYGFEHPSEGSLPHLFEEEECSNEEDKDINIQTQVGNDNHENYRVVRKQKSTRPIFYEFLNKGRADLNVVPSSSSSGSSGVTHVSCNENGSAADDHEESSSCNSFPYIRRKP